MKTLNITLIAIVLISFNLISQRGFEDFDDVYSTSTEMLNAEVVSSTVNTQEVAEETQTNDNGWIEEDEYYDPSFSSVRNTTNANGDAFISNNYYGSSPNATRFNNPYMRYNYYNPVSAGFYNYNSFYNPYNSGWNVGWNSWTGVNVGYNNIYYGHTPHMAFNNWGFNSNPYGYNNYYGNGYYNGFGNRVNSASNWSGESANVYFGKRNNRGGNSGSGSSYRKPRTTSNGLVVGNTGRVFYGNETKEGQAIKMSEQKNRASITTNNSTGGSRTGSVKAVDRVTVVSRVGAQSGLSSSQGNVNQDQFGRRNNSIGITNATRTRVGNSSSSRSTQVVRPNNASQSIGRSQTSTLNRSRPSATKVNRYRTNPSTVSTGTRNRSKVNTRSYSKPTTITRTRSSSSSSSFSTPSRSSSSGGTSRSSSSSSRSSSGTRRGR